MAILTTQGLDLLHQGNKVNSSFFYHINDNCKILILRNNYEIANYPSKASFQQNLSYNKTKKGFLKVNVQVRRNISIDDKVSLSKSTHLS